MRHVAVDVIRAEHQALTAMLRSLVILVAKARREHALPDFELLRAMLFYVDEFPERLHHPKETALLFPAVLNHCPGLAPVLERLQREHAAGERAIRHLQHALLAFEMMGEPRRGAFEASLGEYLQFYLDHMELEEEQILPAALQHLDDAEWALLDAAFASNADPLAGHAPAPDYEPLFRRILRQAEVPLGYGPRGV